MEASSSDCLRNHFLLAMPGLDSGMFSGSITYLCEHGESGAMGIVINQPLELSLAEIFEHLNIDGRDSATRPNQWHSSARSSFEAHKVLAGGPVQIDHGFVLHPGESRRWDSSLQVTDSLQLTTSQDVLKAIALEEGPDEYVVALGYAGWSAGQLEEEIANNSWLTLPANSDIIFRTPIDKRLSAAAAALGVDMNLMTSQAGHA